jgi:hypothetical protein
VNQDQVGMMLVAVGVVVLFAGALDGSVNQGRQRSPSGWLVRNFVTGAPLVAAPMLRRTGSPARALARVGVVAGAAGGAVVATVAGPAALAIAAGAVGLLVLVVARLVERAQRWLVRQGVWADVAWAWLVRNFVSGDPVRVGPALRDTTGRMELLAERAKVAGPRLAGVGVAGGAVYELAGAVVAGGAPGPLWLSFVGGLAVPAAVAVLIGLGLRSAVDRAHFQRWVLPLHLALHGPLGYPLEIDPRKYLVVPRGKAAEGDGVLVIAPPTFGFEDKKTALVRDLTIRKLALADVTDHWEGKAHHSYLQLRPKAHAPDTALFAEIQVQALIEKAKASEPLIGLTIGDKPVAFNLDSETPHLLWSAGTGGGKSSLIRAMVAQLMHHGAHVVVIDLKRHSQPWLRGLPGVTYVRDAEDIHDTFIWLAAEGNRRNKAWDDVPLGGQGPRFPRLVVVCEELNATFSKLRRHWSTIRSSSDPQLSPAVEGFQDLLFMGRAVQINVLAVTQMATAKDLGGPEARENFALRILARYTPNAWKMLVPEITYRPASTIPGRVVVCRAGTAYETQAVFFTDTEARDWATAGRPATDLDVPTSQGERTSVRQGKDPENFSPSPTEVTQTPGRTLTVINGGPNPADEDGERGVTLRQASADEGQGVVADKLHNLRKAPQLDPEFPQPIGTRKVRGGTADVYDPDQLARWHRNRPGTKGVRRDNGAQQ